MKYKMSPKQLIENLQKIKLSIIENCDDTLFVVDGDYATVEVVDSILEFYCGLSETEIEDLE